MKNQEVSSIQEAINLGFRYAIAFKDHYSGNSKGDIYHCIARYAHVCLSHQEPHDRGVFKIIATNEDAPKLVNRRKRIINLLADIRFHTSQNSKLYGGVKAEYRGQKMVFGSWRSIYRSVQCVGAKNFDAKTFATRHDKSLECLRRLLTETNQVSSSMIIRL